MKLLKLILVVFVMALFGTCMDIIPEPDVLASDPTIVESPIPSNTYVPKPQNPRCKKTMKLDGPGGFLWKAESDHGKLVVLFPKEFVNPFEKVRVFKKTKNVKRGKSRKNENLRYTGKANGNRQHWRALYDGRKYTGFVKAWDDDQICKWQVRRPAKRQD